MTRWTHCFFCFLLLSGCISTEPRGDLAGIKQEAVGDAAVVRLESAIDAAGVAVKGEVNASGARLESKIGELQLAVGNLDIKVGNVGGGGDSITAWMYAAIAGAAVLSSLLYPAVIRPMRKYREKQKERRARAHACNPPVDPPG